MSNKYVDFVSDEHFIKCISNLHKAYIKAKKQITKSKFYKNKIDTIKLNFDAKFNLLDEETLIKSEISRQIDKSINNAIGTFHEEILGGIEGFEKGNKSGYDIKSSDDSLFAEVKNKHNTMNSGGSEAVFQKLEKFANDYPKSKCYLVQILATSSFEEKWEAKLNGKRYSHERVFKISGDRFYKLLTKKNNALLQLYKALPLAIDDFLNQEKLDKNHTENSALQEIQKDLNVSSKSLLDQITFDNFGYYLEFDKL